MIITEKIDYENPLLSLRVFSSIRAADQFNNWHLHKETEILAVSKGELEVHIENDIYLLKSGDVVLIGPNQLHRDKAHSEKLDYTVLQFDMEQFFEPSIIQYYNLFAETESSLTLLNYIFQTNHTATREVFECVKQIHQESKEKRRGYEIAVTLSIQRILLALLRSDQRKLIKERVNPEFNRMKPVLDYIEAHLDDKLHVEEACKLANMSYYYFCKFFKKAVGMSFTDYVNYKKIKKSERLLLTKDFSVSYIGELIGMPNMAHFYKCFRKYNGCSPNEFRKKMLSWSH
ncbi:AraC family transcriptional regulator [Marinicrinis lubricantis]|uniref:Helix-turn-helix domain-containing protein n=1 Tax=Marinicrinis lubricantis TaxID=2086470 RepID=A0ABW1IIQ6_9BACL